jgi:DNA replication and repair protein RecF
LLSGVNGAGKTSLLEALYLAATGRSFRTHLPTGCVRRGAAGFHVAATAGEQPRRELALSFAEAGRARTLDGKSAPLAEHIAAQPVLAWTQADHELLTGPPALRRRWLDRALVHLEPGMLDAFARHERALGAKRALLAAGRGGDLEPWNRLLARHGAQLAGGRARLVASLSAGVAAAAERSGLAFATMTVAYRPSPPEALAGEAELARAFAAAAAAERRRGRPLVGAQHDELEVRLAGEPARSGASAGERKALALLLLAALAARMAAAGREPALLVDDADAELDAERLAALLELFSPFAQALFTTSRPALFAAGAGIAHQRVAGGGVRPAPGS